MRFIKIVFRHTRIRKASRDLSCSKLQIVANTFLCVKATHHTYWTYPTWWWTQRYEAPHSLVLFALGYSYDIYGKGGLRRIGPFPGPFETNSLRRAARKGSPAKTTFHPEDQRVIRTSCMQQSALQCLANHIKSSFLFEYSASVSADNCMSTLLHGVENSNRSPMSRCFDKGIQRKRSTQASLLRLCQKNHTAVVHSECW